MRAEIRLSCQFNHEHHHQAGTLVSNAHSPGRGIRSPPLLKASYPVKALKEMVWPLVFVAVSWAVEDKWSAAAVVMMLVYRREMSEILRRRQLTVKLLGFKGYLRDGPRSLDDNAKRCP